MANKDMIISKEEQHKDKLTDRDALNKTQVEDGVKSSVKTTTSLMDELEVDGRNGYVPVSNNSHKIQYDGQNKDIPINSAANAADGASYKKTDVSSSVKGMEDKSSSAKVFEKATKSAQREYAQSQIENNGYTKSEPISSSESYFSAPTHNSYTQEVSSNSESQALVNSESQVRSMVEDGGKKELIHSGSNIDNIHTGGYNGNAFETKKDSRSSSAKTKNSKNKRKSSHRETTSAPKAALNAQEKYGTMVNETSNADYIHDGVKESVLVSQGEKSLITAVDTAKARREAISENSRNSFQKDTQVKKSSHDETTFSTKTNTEKLRDNFVKKQQIYGSDLISYHDEKEDISSSAASAFNYNADGLIKNLPISTSEDTLNEKVIPNQSHLKGVIAGKVVTKALFTEEPKQTYDLLKGGAANAQDEFRMAKLDVQMSKLDIEKAEKDIALLRVNVEKYGLAKESLLSKEAELSKMKEALGKKEANLRKKKNVFISKKKQLERFSRTKAGRELIKESTEKNAKRLGIKRQTDVQSSIKDMIITSAAEGTKKGLLFVGNSFSHTGDSLVSVSKTALKSALYTMADETPEAEGIKQMINVGQTATKTTTAVSKTYKSVKKTMQDLKRLQTKMRLRKQAKAAAAKTGKKIGKGAGELLKTAAKGAADSAKKAVIGAVGYLILLSASMGILFAVILSFIWNTKSVIDTTEISKRIGELDYNMQYEWYNKGKDHLLIDYDNNYDYVETKSLKYNYYYYLMAVDCPIDEWNYAAMEPIGTPKCLIIDYSDYKFNGSSSSQSGKEPGYDSSVFSIKCTSADEMLELYRWTTDDYFSAFAYMQVVQNELNWFEKLNILNITKSTLYKDLDEMHAKTCGTSNDLGATIISGKPFVYEDGSSDNTYTYTAHKSIWDSYKWSKSSTNSNSVTRRYTYHYYFGRRFSVDYLIENNYIRFSDDDAENEEKKERYRQIKKYGNYGVANLEFPLYLNEGEDMRDRIVKHFGDQVYLKYDSSRIKSVTGDEKDVKNNHFGVIKNAKGTHYAIDIKTDPTLEHGNIIIAPIRGLCKAYWREGRGCEYWISTAYTEDNQFDFTKNGYLIKISCAGGTYINTTADPEIVEVGDWLGVAGENMSVNYKIPSKDNDTDYEDIYADKLFPCFTGTDFRDIGEDDKILPPDDYAHIHMEMYKLPCDFTKVSGSDDCIDNCVLNPELFFKYPEEEETTVEASTEITS